MVLCCRSRDTIRSNHFIRATLRKKCPYSELFWPVFSGIRTEYGEILGISPYLVQMRENTDQNNSEYWHFLRIFSRDIYFRFKTILELILYCFLIPIDSHEHLYFEFSCVFPLKIYSIFFCFYCRSVLLLLSSHKRWTNQWKMCYRVSWNHFTLFAIVECW